MKRAEGSSSADRKARRLDHEKQGGPCSRCPPHDGENRGRRPRPDAYKGSRKGR